MISFDDVVIVFAFVFVECAECGVVLITDGRMLIFRLMSQLNILHLRNEQVYVFSSFLNN